MPILKKHRYGAPFWLPGGDAQTMGPRLVCFVPQVPFMREQMELDDGDCIYVDWLFASGDSGKRSDKLVVLSHGLEGDSVRSYMRAMALAFVKRGWDVAARNFRGCGGPMNRLPTLYHSGDVVDLGAVVASAAGKGYGRIGLVGFSMGGNQTLKYLGEKADELPQAVCGGAGVSVPCDLAGCSRVLSRKRNRIYMEYFLRTLRRKMREKHAVYPDLFPIRDIDSIKTFKEFDDLFTAPLNGFANAEDYWEKGACKPFLHKIRKPTLVLNARNDPFLSAACFPEEEARKNANLYLLAPQEGGHVGFPTQYGKTVGWLEETVADFLECGGEGFA